MSTRKIMVGESDRGKTIFGVLEGGRLIFSTYKFIEARDIAGEDAPFEDWQGRPLIYPTELRERIKPSK